MADQVSSEIIEPKKPTEEAAQYSVASLFATEFPANRWWVPGLIPKGGITLIGGPEKIGKSWVNNGLSRCCVLGKTVFEPEPGYPALNFQNSAGELFVPPTAEPCRVLLVDMELGAPTLKSRLQTIFQKDLDADKEATLDAVEDRFFYLTRPRRGEAAVNLSDESGKTRLWKACDACAPHIIVIDPINMAHSLDEDSNTQIQQLFHTLYLLQDSLIGLETSIVIAHHFKKIQGDPKNHDALNIQNFRGAGKYTNAADSIITMDIFKSPDNTKKHWNLQLQVTGRHGPGTPKLQLGFNFRDDGRVYFRKCLD